MAGAGYKLFATGDVLTAAQVNTYLQEQTVMSFADSAARTTALSGVLAEGMMSYLRDTNAVQVYNGSAWVAVGGSSPLTTKGDLYGFSTLDARIPIGANDTVLTADSTQSLGLKWGAVSGFGAYTAWTPVIDQGGTTNIAQSGTQAFYAVSGEFVHAYATINLNGAGTASNQVEVSYPVAPNTGMNQSMNIGVGAILDVSPLKMYNATPTRGTASRMYFLPTNDASFNLSYLGGVVFTAALAAGDAVYLNVHYRKA